MPLVQRSRFGLWLKNLTGFRGPLSINLDGGVSPVYDFSNSDPEQDQEVAWWIGPTFNIAAVAAQFSTAQVKCLSGMAWVRGVIIGGQQTAAQAYQLGITAEFAGATGVTLANNYLNNRSSAFSVATASLGSVVQATRNNAATAFSFSQFTIGMIATNAPDFVFPFPIPFVISPGWACSIEPTVVNQPVRGNFFGTFRGDQL